MLTKRDYEIIEGRFHDGLGTYAELALANALIRQGRIAQSPFDLSNALRKMRGAIEDLPSDHAGVALFSTEIRNIENAAEAGATYLLNETDSVQICGVLHVASQYVGGQAGDILIQFEGHPSLAVSVKTDKSGKVAIADGQTPDIANKWAGRFLGVTDSELDAAVAALGHSSLTELRADYLNVAELVAYLIRLKLKVVNGTLTDFSQARATDLEAVKRMLRQLLAYKKGSDGSHVLIFSRATGSVGWETLLDAVDIEMLTLEQISFRPSIPRAGRRIGSEFGIKVDGKAVVTFQVKHRRGKHHGTNRQSEFLDITTRLTTT